MPAAHTRDVICPGADLSLAIGALLLEIAIAAPASPLAESGMTLSGGCMANHHQPLPGGGLLNVTPNLQAL
jgi:hypothetical protein